VSDIWQSVFSVLEANGIDAYSPAQHEGECKSKYVVIKTSGVNKYGDFSVATALYDVMCYVPKGEYSTLESFVRTVKGVLKNLHPMIKPTGFETPSFYDDTIKGHMISVQYLNYRKL
jgi:hypothetical protein